MGTIVNGNAAEAAVIKAFVLRGLPTLTPFGEGHPYDVAIDFGGPTVIRVQCKKAWVECGAALFNGRRTDHGSGPGSYVGLADAFGVYMEDNDTVYVVPVDAALPARVSLRLEPTRNSQKRRVRPAARYELDRWTDADLAALATVPAVVGLPNTG